MKTADTPSAALADALTILRPSLNVALAASPQRPGRRRLGVMDSRAADYARAVVDLTADWPALAAQADTVAIEAVRCRVFAFASQPAPRGCDYMRAVLSRLAAQL